MELREYGKLENEVDGNIARYNNGEKERVDAITLLKVSKQQNMKLIYIPTSQPSNEIIHVSYNTLKNNVISNVIQKKPRDNKNHSSPCILIMIN